MREKKKKKQINTGSDTIFYDFSLVLHSGIKDFGFFVIISWKN